MNLQLEEQLKGKGMSARFKFVGAENVTSSLAFNEKYLREFGSFNLKFEIEYKQR